METPAQYTERMREKYKEALEKLEKEGSNKFQKVLDKGLDNYLNVRTKTPEALEKLSDILKRY